MNSKIIGTISEFKIAIKFMQMGLVVLQPIEDNARFDYVVYNKETKLFNRIQCKTGRYNNGVVHFNCKNIYHTFKEKSVWKSYIGDIDYFVVYCPELDTYYMIPIDDVGDQRGFSIRIDPTRNSNKIKIHWSTEYQF